MRTSESEFNSVITELTNRANQETQTLENLIKFITLDFERPLTESKKGKAKEKTNFEILLGSEAFSAETIAGLPQLAKQALFQVVYSGENASHHTLITSTPGMKSNLRTLLTYLFQNDTAAVVTTLIENNQLAHVPCRVDRGMHGYIKNFRQNTVNLRSDEFCIQYENIAPITKSSTGGFKQAKQYDIIIANRSCPEGSRISGFHQYGDYIRTQDFKKEECIYRGKPGSTYNNLTRSLTEGNYLTQEFALRLLPRLTPEESYQTTPYAQHYIDRLKRFSIFDASSLKINVDMLSGFKLSVTEAADCIEMWKILKKKFGNRIFKQEFPNLWWHPKKNNETNVAEQLHAIRNTMLILYVWYRQPKRPTITKKPIISMLERYAKSVEKNLHPEEIGIDNYLFTVLLDILTYSTEVKDRRYKSVRMMVRRVLSACIGHHFTADSGGLKEKLLAFVQAAPDSRSYLGLLRLTKSEAMQRQAGVVDFMHGVLKAAKKIDKPAEEITNKKINKTTDKYESQLKLFQPKKLNEETGQDFSIQEHGLAKDTGFIEYDTL